MVLYYFFFVLQASLQELFSSDNKDFIKSPSSRAEKDLPSQKQVEKVNAYTHDISAKNPNILAVYKKKLFLPLTAFFFYSYHIVAIFQCITKLQYMYFQLLLQAEDANDAKAASQAKAEQVAEMAEFDENFQNENASR